MAKSKKKEPIERIHETIHQLHNQVTELEKALEHGGTAARNRVENLLGLSKSTVASDSRLRDELAERREELDAAYELKREYLQGQVDDAIQDQKDRQKAEQQAASEFMKKIKVAEVELRELKKSWGKHQQAAFGASFAPDRGIRNTYKADTIEGLRLKADSPESFVRLDELDRLEREQRKQQARLDGERFSAGPIEIWVNDEGIITDWEIPFYLKHDRIKTVIVPEPVSQSDRMNQRDKRRA